MDGTGEQYAKVYGLDFVHEGYFFTVGKVTTGKNEATAVALPAMCILPEGRQEVETLAFRYPPVSQLLGCVRQLRSLTGICDSLVPGAARKSVALYPNFHFP